MSSQDLRYLLITNKLPEYDQSKLINIWEFILKEYEILTNTYTYSQALRKASSDTSKVNRLNGLKACYYLLKMAPEIAIEDLKHWKIFIKDNSEASLNKLLTIINQELTRLKIAEIQPKLEQSKIEFENLLVYVENSLERNLDIEKTTVKKWIYIIESIEKKAESIKKIINGREYSTSK